jgi:tripartite-type tricarboxylate transporter receptor subunit TctC
MRRQFLFRLAAIAAMAGYALAPASAQIAEQPIKIVFPFAAGGVGDAFARLLAENLREGLKGQPVVVENVTGAAGRAGARSVVTATPDGKTLLFTPIAPVAVHNHVYKDLGYDPLTDLAPVSLVAEFEFGIAVGPNVPVKNLKELVAWAKANPAKASYGSPGAGALPHFFGVLFGKAAGIDLVHIGYKGSAAAITDLVGGQIPIVVTTTSDLLAQHQAGKIRILATSDSKRSPLVPDVPTFKESGFDIVGTSWYAVFAPAKTPPDLREKYAKILAMTVQRPEIKERLLKMGLYAAGTTPDELGKVQKRDSAHWAPAVNASGFKADQ